MSHGAVRCLLPASGVVRTIVEPRANYDLAGAEWSPDGSQIVYHSWGGPGAGVTAQSRMSSRRMARATACSLLRGTPFGMPGGIGPTMLRGSSSFGYTPGYRGRTARGDPVGRGAGRAPRSRTPAPSSANAARCGKRLTTRWSSAPPERRARVSRYNRSSSIRLAGTIRPTAWATTSDPTCRPARLLDVPPAADKEEPRVGRDPGFRKRRWLRGLDPEPVTFGL